MSNLQTVQTFYQAIQDRFAGQSGWFCLGTIAGDPDLEKMKQEWYLLPRQRAELAERCAELAARGLNLYLGGMPVWPAPAFRCGCAAEPLAMAR